MKIAKVRQMADECATRELLVKKFEFDKRVSTAEQNRQREIQRRVQAIRQHVISPFFVDSILLSLISYHHQMLAYLYPFR